MGEYVDKLVRLQPDDLISLSLLERVRGYDKQVDGKTVHVSPHTRAGEGPGKAQKGEYKVFHKGKDVFTNKHGVDTANIHSTDQIHVDSAGFKDVTGMWQDEYDGKHYPISSESLRKKLNDTKSFRVDKVSDSHVTVRHYGSDLHIPVEHVTKVEPHLVVGQKKLSKEDLARRSKRAELNRVEFNKSKITRLEAETGISDSDVAKDAAREKEIVTQMQKLQDELAEIKKRNSLRKKAA